MHTAICAQAKQEPAVNKGPALDRDVAPPVHFPTSFEHWKETRYEEVRYPTLCHDHADTTLQTRVRTNT
jgi:hypothetical protein